MNESYLGPLADPTPSERALSLLHMACGKLRIAWPAEEGTLAIIKVELRALELATICRQQYAFCEASKCNDMALACFWTISAILSARMCDKATERRHAMRASEYLDWVSP